MASDEIKNLPLHERMAHFYKLWEMHKRAGDFEVTQEATDRLAAMCNVPAPRVKVRDDDGPRGRFLETY
ncbi:hypothetical protein [Polyangium spumosum]|uniref:Uncharacterized protein n=1 Tax=Polyangium spumosum TaxID=889282 RepID=A0A6N7PRY9_9BACT|nr:hypothetical protein [Polyangium spumosum]MRG92814.1 hypothetical protein [Polyangium spumosum]